MGIYYHRFEWYYDASTNTIIPFLDYDWCRLLMAQNLHYWTLLLCFVFCVYFYYYVTRFWFFSYSKTAILNLFPKSQSPNFIYSAVISFSTKIFPHRRFSFPVYIQIHLLKTFCVYLCKTLRIDSNMNSFCWTILTFHRLTYPNKLIFHYS